MPPDLRQDGAMSQTSTAWHRLHEIAEKRLGQLGIPKGDLPQYGGPSPSWFRGMKDNEGLPSIRQKPSLDELDRALSWPTNTSWNFLRDDRVGWSEAMLEDEEDRLVHADAPTPSGNGLTVDEQEIRHFATMLQIKLRHMSPESAASLMSDINRLADLG
jgi:hypothetical protein